MIGGYGSQEAGFSLFVVNNLKLPIHVIGVIFFFNTSTIVCSQLWVLNRIEGKSRTKVMATVALFWLVFWVILDAALALPKVLAIVSLCVAMVVFALGETMLSPVGPALVNEIAPEHLRGRYNAAAGLAWGVSGTLAPAITALYFNDHLGNWWPLGTGLTALVGGALMLRLRHLLSASEDGREPRTPVPRSSSTVEFTRIDASRRYAVRRVVRRPPALRAQPRGRARARGGIPMSGEREPLTRARRGYFRLYSYGPSVGPTGRGRRTRSHPRRQPGLHRGQPLRRSRSSAARATARRLLAELEACARELQRPTLVIFVIEGSREIGTGPNRSFAARHGYRVAEENVRRDLAWPRPEGELDRLWDEWRPFATDYEIISWSNGHAGRATRRPERICRRSCRPRRRTWTSTSRPNTGTRHASVTTKRRPIRWDATSSSRRRGTAPPASSSASANSPSHAISPRRPTSGTRWSYVTTGATDWADC